MKVEKLTDQDEFVRVLYYGDFGSAKTTNLAALARLGKVIFVNFESGVKKKPLMKLDIPVENIGVVSATGYDDAEEVFWSLDEKAKSGKGLPAGVLLDSVTMAQTRFVQQNVEEAVEAAEARGVTKDPFRADQDAWTRANEQIRRIVRRFYDLPMHVGLAALERRDVDEDDGRVAYGPSLTPGCRDDVCGYMDVVIRTHVEQVGPDEEQFWGQCRRVGKYIGKDRFKMLPTQLATPTMDRVIAWIEGKLTAENDEVQKQALAVRRASRSSGEAKPATPPKRAAEPRRPQKKGEE